jgi:hypothetical protein
MGPFAIFGSWRTVLQLSKNKDQNAIVEKGLKMKLQTFKDQNAKTVKGLKCKFEDFKD